MEAGSPTSRFGSGISPRRAGRDRRFGAVLTVAWLLGGAALCYGLDRRLDAIAKSENAGDPVPTALLEDHQLFSRIRDLGLLTIEDGWRLLPPPSDWALRQFSRPAAGQSPPPLEAGWAERREAVKALYGAANGRYVLSQLELWNRTLTPAAIRDNAGAAIGVETQWFAADARGWSVPPLSMPVPGRFHGFAAAAPAGMSAWKVFGAEEHGEIRLSARLSPPFPAAGATVQVLGRLDPAGLPEGWRAIGDCRGPDCVTHVLQGPSGAAGDVELVLRVWPVERVRRDGDGGPMVDKGWVTAGTTRIALDRDGKPTWRAAARPAPKFGVTEVATADGVTLIDAGDGKPTEAAARLGLLSLTGQGADDPRGVAGLVARRRERQGPVRVDLTIDSRIQAAAVAAMGSAMAEPFAVGLKAADPFQRQRRGVLVVTNPDTGAILASAVWPPPPSGLDLWSVNAHSYRNPADDPFAPLGWQGIDSGRAPGSTGKLAAAAALLSAAPSQPRIDALVKGCAPLADGTLPCLGFRTGTTGYAVPPQGEKKEVRNFFIAGRGYQRAGDSIGPARLERAPECVGGARIASKSLGLPQAVRDSVNVYFVRGAELLDAEEARRYDHAMRRIPKNAPYPAPPSLRLADGLKQLGFDEAVDLAGAARPWLNERGGPGTSVLEAAPAYADIFDLLARPPFRADRVKWQEIGAVDTISRTAIGQQLYATPLQMARLAATLRGGGVPQPYLLAAWNGLALPPPPVRPLPATDLSPLAAGMKMVPETGTAAGAKGFGRWAGTSAETARCHVYGKTGTAEVAVTGKHPHTTAWFVGWAEPQALAILNAGAEAELRRPLAFACMVTHGMGERRTGGGVCAPIVADFLERLARTNHRQASLTHNGASQR